MLIPGPSPLLACLLGASTLLAQPAAKPLQGEARKALLARIEKTMASARQVAARFVQDKQLKLFGDTVRSSGWIAFARPDHLRWEIRSPFRSLLIVTGRQVAKFEFRGKKRRKLELGRGGELILMVMSQIRDWFRGDFGASQKVYRLELFAGPPARIVLRPKDGSLQKNLDSITLHLAKDLRSVERVRILEKGGDQTWMRFGPPLLDPKLPEACFDTEAPSSVQPDELKLRPVPAPKARSRPRPRK